MGEMNKKLQSKNLKERDHLEELGVDGTIILKWALKKTGYEGMGWILLA
jgi:hypothetical protein